MRSPACAYGLRDRLHGCGSAIPLAHDYGLRDRCHLWQTRSRPPLARGHYCMSWLLDKTSVARSCGQPLVTDP
ncbi:hypothetical protein B296_00040571 [Ensete ventricosum]|uniref:Uncharacterized protein n=1 Tax=Ensete ventricosum TaxID=4639 RepID=A0A426YB20_ENSVE|nr:hypothetical protein B296_00040571 [Ensete ventricosum]